MNGEQNKLRGLDCGSAPSRNAVLDGACAKAATSAARITKGEILASSAALHAIEQKREQEEQRHREQRREYVNAMLTTFNALEGPTAGLFRSLANAIYGWNLTQGFWESDNTAEKLALMHSELSEALEADRKGLMSDHIPAFTGIEEELADCMVRILDFAGKHQLRLAEAFIAKLQYNLSRPYKHGKEY